MKNKSIVWTFARANPPTKGHKLLFDTVRSKAGELGSEHLIVLSQTQKYPDNPLSWKDKVSAVKEIYDGDVSISENEEFKTPFQVLEYLCLKYDEIHLIVGEDRKDEFDQKMAKYASEWGCNRFQIHSAGLRDGSTKLSSVSGTRARNAIYNNDHETFIEMCPEELTATTITKIFYNATIRRRRETGKDWFIR